MGAVVLITAFLSVSCSGGDSKEGESGGADPGSSASAQAFPHESCLRDLGIEFTVDDGKSIPDKGKNTPEDLQAAITKCGGAAVPTLDAAALEVLRKQAKCMRAEGITEFRDPTATGEAVPDDALEKQLGSPEGKKALKKCGITAEDPGSDPGDKA
ncbi:hypothetical protein ACIQZN_08605 [Streptomyces sp. NPDC097595]|uniref:hypothetical protein n=1 Tax=Streptomyces sp. NPDC097595 TaxID=3366090 RepID=UPI00381621E9